MRPLLTVAVIAKDEERTLPSLFASLRGLSQACPPRSMQMVVVDTGSGDGTRAVAQSHGAEVHAFAWCDDFSAARNRSLELSRGGWILWMDADDELPEGTRAWLAQNLSSLNPDRAYAFRVRSPGPDGGASECAQIRLFPNRPELRFRNAVHENIGDSVLEAGMGVDALPLDILHTGYRDPATVERKRIRNRALLAKALSLSDSAPAPSLWLAWGRMMLGENRFAEAESAFRSAMAHSASTPNQVLLAAGINLGQCLCFLNRAPEALQVFRALRAFPASHASPSSLIMGGCDAHAPYLLEYGKALWLTGHVAEARDAWTACLNADGRGAGSGSAGGSTGDAGASSGNIARGPDIAFPAYGSARRSCGSVPTDWQGIRDGASALLRETASMELPREVPRARTPDVPDFPIPADRGGGGRRRLDLSICSIVRDEAPNLEGLLAGIPLDRVEWIVMDTGSRDATVEILLQAGIGAHAFAWCDDFSAARNASLRLATRGWILWIDADDRLDEAFWEALEPLLDGPRRAYRFTVRSPRENSRGDCFRQIRLFPNNLGIAFEGRIHEQTGTSLQKLGVPVENAELEIVHMGYDTAAKRGAKLKRNRAMLEQERLAHPADPAVGMEYGNCLYQSGEYPAAKDAYLAFMPAANPRACGAPPADEVLRHFPTLLAETCAKQGADAEAAEWFRLAAEWNPSDIKPLYWLGKRALAGQNVHGALEYFYAALDRPVAVGRVATDNHTVRRNALALVVLCEMRLFGADKAPRGRQCLRELIDGGLQDLPLDPRVPWEFLRAAGSDPEADADAERYARAWLKLAPGDIALWEDLAEMLLTAGRHGHVMEMFTNNPSLRMRSGVLEAFRAKSGESEGESVERVYAIYRDALARFSDDPTLLVYFSDFVNHNKLYSRCYSDLKALPRPSETMRDFLRQMEALGYGNGGPA
jgi:glycosyltransferase involved in cell wall biosynthesis